MKNKTPKVQVFGNLQSYLQNNNKNKTKNLYLPPETAIFNI